MQNRTIGEWLEERLEKERLSLRQAAARAGLSHATINDIIKGVRPTPETIKKLAQAFAGDGTYMRLALEDKLLLLAGYRTEHPEGELTEPMARLLDKLNQFSEPQLKIMGRFADFLSELEKKK